MKTYAPEHKSILQEAQETTHGRAQQDYGNPYDDYSRTADLVNVLLRTEFTASDIALIMVCVKLSRESYSPKRDNRVDLAGYAWVLDRCKEQEEYDYAQTMIEAQAAGVPVGTSHEAREMLDIPHFLRQDPGLLKAAER